VFDNAMMAKIFTLRIIIIYYYYLAWHQGNEIAMMPFSPLGT